MKFLAFFLSGLVIASSSLAQDRALSAAEFDALTRGRTFLYFQGGAAYGDETYLPNRRVRWSFRDGQCQEGQWFEDLGLICFVYDTDPVGQCWSFFETPDGIKARNENDPDDTELYVATPTEEPQYCLGPKVGV